MAEWRNGGMVEWQLNGGMDSTYVAISAILPFCHSFCRSAIPAIPAIWPFRLPYRHSVCHFHHYFCCGLQRSYINSWLRSLHACICNFFHSVNNSHIMTNSWIYQYCTVLHSITNDITNADFRAVGPIGLYNLELFIIGVTDLAHILRSSVHILLNCTCTDDRQFLVFT